MTSNIRLIQDIIMPVILLAHLSPPALDGNLAKADGSATAVTVRAHSVSSHW